MVVPKWPLFRASALLPIKLLQNKGLRNRMGLVHFVRCVVGRICAFWCAGLGYDGKK